MDTNKNLCRGDEIFNKVTGEVGRITWFQRALQDDRLLFIETMDNNGRFQMWPVNNIEIL